MTNGDVTLRALKQLAEIDTATICNALEVLRPEYRDRGYTKRPLVAARPNFAPIVGLARVGTIRAESPARAGSVLDRIAWYEYVAAGDLPTIVVIEDQDSLPGTGAFWGEVNSLVHKTLGATGCVTNGSFRDVGALADGFQILGGHVGPSHAHVHISSLGEPIEVCGMKVEHDDLIHADYQGAVVIPHECVLDLPRAVELVTRRERVILDVCRDTSFNFEMLREAMARSKEIH
jgi:regulator of RNase E activity RraA